MKPDARRFDLPPRDAVWQRKIAGCLSAAGIGFWFLIGFPFGNHNESYYWLSRLEQQSFWEIVRTHTLAATFRPVGQGLAYAGWRISGGSSWPVQLFSFIVAALALYAIALSLKETATFAVGMALAGGIFFAGYIYLFHLHGIFYSPILMLLAVFLWLEQTEYPTLRKELVVFACALAIGLLFHPYALILYIAFLAGRIAEAWKQSSVADRALQTLFALVTAVILLVSRPHGHEVFSSANLRALVTSYHLTESPHWLALVSAILAAATLSGIETLGQGLRIGLAAIALLCSAVCALVGFPVLLVWIAAAVFKMAYVQRWSLALVTAAAALLPGIAPSGSPTYAIFVVLLSVIALSWRWSTAEQLLLPLGSSWAIAVIFLAMLVGSGVRMGVRVPMVSRLAQPLLAEKEKTWQLEAIIQWMMASDYRNWHLQVEGIVNPADSATQAIDRRYRPPTYQIYLDSYLASQGNNPRDPRVLMATFGDRRIDAMTQVYVVEGRFAGPAMVFK